MSGRRNSNPLPPTMPGLKAGRSRTEPDNAEYFIRNLKPKRDRKLSVGFYNAIGMHYPPPTCLYAYFQNWNWRMMVYQTEEITTSPAT
jgi:hypothetical protein